MRDGVAGLLPLHVHDIFVPRLPVLGRDLSGVLSAIDACDAEVMTREAELTAARETLAAHERTSDLARMEALRGAVRVMRRQLRRLARNILPSVSSAAAAAGAQEIDALTGAASPADAESFGLHVPADPELGIDIDGEGHTSGQAAALELLACERELLLDELGAVCGRWGHELDLGDETPDEEAPPPPGAAAAAARKSPAQPSAAAASAASPPAAAAAAAVESPPASTVDAPADSGASSSFSFLQPAAAPEALAEPFSGDAAGLGGSAFGFLGSAPEGGVDGGLLAGLSIAPTGAHDGVFLLPSGGDVAPAASLFGGLLPAAAGAGDETGATSEVQEEPAPAPAPPAGPTPEELAAQRVLRLASIAAGLRAADAAIAEKQGVIDASVAQEDFDTAGELMRCLRNSQLVSLSLSLSLSLARSLSLSLARLVRCGSGRCGLTCGTQGCTAGRGSCSGCCGRS